MTLTSSTQAGALIAGYQQGASASSDQSGALAQVVVVAAFSSSFSSAFDSENAK